MEDKAVSQEQMEEVTEKQYAFEEQLFEEMLSSGCASRWPHLQKKRKEKKKEEEESGERK